MAYPTGFRKTRAGTVSAHPGYGCRWGENERGDSNGKTTQMSEKPACRGGVRRVPGKRRAYPISASAGSFSLITTAKTKFYPLGCIPAQVKPELAPYIPECGLATQTEGTTYFAIDSSKLVID